MAVAVRPGSRGDRAFVLDLGRRSAGSSISAIRTTGDAPVIEAFERLAAFVWTRDHELLVAEEAGASLGFVITLYDVPDEVTMAEQAFVAYTAVEPAARGRGVGAVLLKEAERRARERGMHYVSLMVTEDNVPARALYERAGFATERRMLTKPL